VRSRFSHSRAGTTLAAAAAAVGGPRSALGGPSTATTNRGTDYHGPQWLAAAAPPRYRRRAAWYRGPSTATARPRPRPKPLPRLYRQSLPRWPPPGWKPAGPRVPGQLASRRGAKYPLFSRVKLRRYGRGRLSQGSVYTMAPLGSPSASRHGAACLRPRTANLDLGPSVAPMRPLPLLRRNLATGRWCNLAK
jgi:hypothetical protein